jgi:hypothetical protein
MIEKSSRFASGLFFTLSFYQLAILAHVTCFIFYPLIICWEYIFWLLLFEISKKEMHLFESLLLKDQINEE